MSLRGPVSVMDLRLTVTSKEINRSINTFLFILFYFLHFLVSLEPTTQDPIWQHCHFNAVVQPAHMWKRFTIVQLFQVASVYSSFAVYGKNMFWPGWDFWLQYLDWPLEFTLDVPSKTVSISSAAAMIDRKPRHVSHYICVSY